MAFPANLRGLSDPSTIQDPGARHYVQEVQDALIELAAQVEGIEPTNTTEVTENSYNDAPVKRRLDDLQWQIKLIDVTAAATAYSGPFAITDNGDDTLDISAGKVINGTTVSSIAASTGESVAGKSYLSLEVWYNAAWKSDYLASTSYPTQAVKTDGGTDYPCFRRNIAEKVSGAWTQRFNDSEIVNPRVAE